MRRPEDLNFLERTFVTEVIRGLFVTGGRFWRNLFLHIGHQVGVAKDTGASVTLQYPEQYMTYGPTYRGSHRLTLKDDDSVRCTACFLCATACPARCIHIEAGEHPDPTVEKFPLRYEIDTLRCIYCGMCVEACPCDAIRMDTSVHPKVGRLLARGLHRGQDRPHGPLARDARRGRGALMDQMIDSLQARGRTARRTRTRDLLLPVARRPARAGRQGEAATSSSAPPAIRCTFAPHAAGIHRHGWRDAGPALRAGRRRLAAVPRRPRRRTPGLRHRPCRR